MRTSQAKMWPRVLLVLIMACAPLVSLAQPGKLELRNLEKLSEKAEDVNDITLEGPVLQLTVKFLDATHDPDAAQLKEAIKGLKGIYVKSFEFDKPNQYSAADVEAIRSQLSHPGWTRVAESHSKRHAEHDEIYLFKEGDKVAGLTILVAEPTELSVVNIVGLIDFDKLGALAGKFGIPEEIKDQTKNKQDKHKTKPDQKENPDQDQEQE